MQKNAKKMQKKKIHFYFLLYSFWFSIFLFSFFLFSFFSFFHFFFANARYCGEECCQRIVSKTVDEIERLRTHLQNFPPFLENEIIGSSLLLMHDAHGRVGVFWVDFSNIYKPTQGFAQDKSATKKDDVLFGLGSLLTELEALPAAAKLQQEQPPCTLVHSFGQVGREGLESE